MTTQVEVKGIDVNNKGALLMLFSIIEQFEKRNIAARFTIEMNRDFALQRKYDVDFILPSHGQGSAHKLANSMLNVTPKFIRNIFRIVVPKEIDVVFDASGFAYSDQWGAKKAKGRLGNFSSRYRKNTPLIVLPQAFGPFNDKNVAEAVRLGMENADLIFARDKESYTWMKKTIPNSEKLKLSPDFTQGLDCKNVPNILPAELKDSIFLVLNSKMVEKGGFTRESYLKWFEDAVQEIRKAGDEPIVINHEGPADADLSEALAKRCNLKTPVISDDNPLVLKKVISQCKGGIVSRFHAAVSALSQGVPVIMFGWSHKYEELARDYDSLELFSKNQNSPKESTEVLFSYINCSEKLSIITNNANNAKARVKLMWENVFPVFTEMK